MNRTTLITLKTLTWIACLSPFALLIYQFVTNALGPDPTSNIALTTGYNTLLLLILSLAITPLRLLSPRLSRLIKFRRLLGLFAFFYASLHLATYIALYMNFDLSVFKTDITKRRFIIAGFLAYTLLVPLAATSTTWAIRKLGGKRWNQSAQAGLPRSHLRNHPLLVAGETRRQEPHEPDHRALRAAGCAAGPGICPEDQSSARSCGLSAPDITG